MACIFYLFRSELDELQKKYGLVRIKRELQGHYAKREELEAEFDDLEVVIDKELDFNASLKSKCVEIKVRIRERIMENIYKDNVNFKLLEEIRLAQVRKTLPGLLQASQRPRYRDPNGDQREGFVPGWMMLAPVLFMAWTVVNAHYPALFVGGVLFFLGFAQSTVHFHTHIDFKPSLLVGFFLAGLVMYGGVQGWWIAPILGSLGELPLMLGATGLTAVNDNAAITYLSTLVPGFNNELKYAVVAGAVTGGGLTVIANAPNPAGQSILKRYFSHGVSPAGLFKAALLPTVIMALCFLLLRF